LSNSWPKWSRHFKVIFCAADAAHVSLSINPLANTLAVRRMAAPVSVPVESVTQALADLAAKRLTQTVVVQDTQDNLQANLAGLQKLALAGKLSGLNISDGDGNLQFNANQLASDTALVNKLVSFGRSVSVADNAANLVHITSRITTNLTVTVTDSVVNVQKNLSGLQALAVSNKLDTLVFTDSSPALTLTASQYVSVAALRNKMPAAAITVTDTAANMAKYNISDATTWVVKDSAANVLRNFAPMRTLAASSHDMSVQLTDHAPAMAMSASQFVGSTDLRAKLTGVDYTIKDTAQAIADNAVDLSGLKVSVTDIASHVQANLDVLQSFAEAGTLTSLKVTDASKAKLNMTVVQALKLGNLSGAAITLTDTAVNIQNNFDALLGVKKINAIQLTDTARPVLQVSDAQYKKGSAVLGKITGAAVAVKFNGNLSQYKISANNDGSFNVGNTNYQKVNFLAFNDTTTYADTGDTHLNALLMGGTNYWWGNSTGAMTTSDASIKTNVYAMGAASSKQIISYSFLNAVPQGDTADSYGFRPMSNTQQASVRSAFEYLSSLIGVTFVESSTPGSADINLGTNNQASKNSSGYANVPNGSGDHAAFLFLDNSLGNLNTTLAQGSYGWQTLIHELGHTLGLKHPGNYNAGGGGTPGPYLPNALDNRAYTLMSYNNAPASLKVTATAHANGAYSYSANTVNDSTYMMYDIAALQFLYGKGTGQNLDAYQTSTFNANWSGMETLWMPDSGTLDASLTQNSNIIDLRAGAFSSINVIPKSITDSFPNSLKTSATYMGLNNVALAYGSQVTAADGGAGNDIFYTNTDSNVTIDGGAGNDTVYLAGNASDWQFKSDTSSYFNTKLSRRVTVHNIEAIKYYNADTFSLTHTRLDLSA
jgi:Metallo-peptidase family M12